MHAKSAGDFIPNKMSTWENLVTCQCDDDVTVDCVISLGFCARFSVTVTYKMATWGQWGHSVNGEDESVS